MIGTADGQAPSVDNPIAIHFKGITITPGRVPQRRETVFRNKATRQRHQYVVPEQIPHFPATPARQTTEFNASARQSRLSMLAEGKAGLRHTGRLRERQTFLALQHHFQQ